VEKFSMMNPTLLAVYSQESKYRVSVPPGFAALFFKASLRASAPCERGLFHTLKRNKSPPSSFPLKEAPLSP